MKNVSTVCFLVITLIWAGSAIAQTTHEVNVGNFSFTPKSLTIEKGDIVVWTNTEGTHNVNGTAVTFPDNPESFGNDVAAATWEYSFTFNTAGTYGYHCDPHAGFGMTGTITVTTTTSLNEQESKNGIKLYPVPAKDYLTIELGESYADGVYQLEVYNLTGSLVFTKELQKSKLNQINTANLPVSNYLYRIVKNGVSINAGKFLKKD